MRLVPATRRISPGAQPSGRNLLTGICTPCALRNPVQCYRYIASVRHRGPDHLKCRIPPVCGLAGSGSKLEDDSLLPARGEAASPVIPAHLTIMLLCYQENHRSAKQSIHHVADTQHSLASHVEEPEPKGSISCFSHRQSQLESAQRIASLIGDLAGRRNPEAPTLI